MSRPVPARTTIASLQKAVEALCEAADAVYAQMRAAHAGPDEETERRIREMDIQLGVFCRAVDAVAETQRRPGAQV